MTKHTPQQFENDGFNSPREVEVAQARAAKHTPGPWKQVLQYGLWHVRQDPADWKGMGYQHICSLPSERKGGHYGDMFAANARLIAAAPELLEALNACLTAMTALHCGEVSRAAIVAAARAAIAKATGSAR